MQAKLIHRINEINLEDGGNLKSLDIRYNGTFVGKILGDTSVSLSRSKINITFLSEPESILMRYSGNFKIIDVFGVYDDDSVQSVYFKLINDEVQKIKAQWDSSTQKWEDYNKSNKYHRPVIPIVEYSENDTIKYQEARGKSIISPPLRQRNILNKIRGDYGIK